MTCSGFKSAPDYKTSQWIGIACSDVVTEVSTVACSDVVTEVSTVACSDVVTDVSTVACSE